MANLAADDLTPVRLRRIHPARPFGRPGKPHDYTLAIRSAGVFSFFFNENSESNTRQSAVFGSPQRLAAQTMLLADRGYDADWIRELVCQQGAWANIPPKRNRKDPICFSPYLYRARNLIERFFNKIKQCRRVATRYDKLAANYLAFVKLVSRPQQASSTEVTDPRFPIQHVPTDGNRQVNGSLERGDQA